MPQTKTTWNKQVSSNFKLELLKTQGNWSQGVKGLSGSAIFWCFCVEMINVNLACPNKGNSFCQGPRKSEGAFRYWRCLKMDIKTRQENRYPPTAYTGSTYKTIENSCPSLDSKDTENLPAYTRNFHTSLSTLSLLVRDKTSHAPPLPYQASHHLSLTLQAFQDATVPHIRLVWCLVFGVEFCQRHSQPQAATDEAPPQANQKLAT